MSSSDRERCGPETVFTSALDNVLPSLGKIPPRAVQSVVSGSTKAASEFEDGLTPIYHLTIFPLTNPRALLTFLPVISSALIRNVL